MRKLLLGSAAAALGAVALVVAGQALAQRQGPPPGTYETTPVGQYAFFAASQPANSSHVGIFIARRLPNKAPQLYYCSSPSDAGAQQKTACREINAFPK